MDLINSGYKNWIGELKSRISTIQIKAAIAVHKDLVMFYLELGAEMVKKQESYHWGDGFIKQLSKDLSGAFPQMKGFSVRNLKYIRQWYLFWSESEIGQQLVARLCQIPWGHNLVIVSKCKDIKEAVYYIQNIIENAWSRSVLVHQIENGLYSREGKAINNFENTLLKANSDLAREALKAPYIFDLFTLTRIYRAGLEKEPSGAYNGISLRVGSRFCLHRTAV